MDDGSSGIGSGSAALTGGASGDKPRQKRKYTRKLGPDGLPLKRRTGVSVGRKSLIPDDGKPKKRGRPRKADKEREIRDKERAKEEDEEFNTLDLLQQESPGRGPGPEDFRAPGDADGEAGPANATVNANASDIPIDANDDEDDIVDMDTWAEFAKGGKKRDGINHLTLERTLTTADYERYVMAYRGGLQKASVKKAVQQLMTQQIPPNIPIIVAGAAKIFVGEMTEKAKEVMQDWNDSGAIRPEHLREAQRRYYADKQSSNGLGAGLTSSVWKR